MYKGQSPRRAQRAARVCGFVILFLFVGLTQTSIYAGDALWSDVTPHQFKVLPNVEPTDVHMYGRAVALDGDRMIVGAQSGNDLGAAYVFRLDPATETWVEEQKLQASDGDVGDEFGYSVALDGDLAAIGALQDDDDGSAYIFRFVDGEWTEEQIIHGVGAIALSLDGDRLAIGDQYDDELGFVAGAVRVFLYDTGENEWEEDQKLTASDGDSLDRFGYELDLDGDRLAIGAFQAEYQGVGSGAVYIFEYARGDWSEVDKVGEDDGGASLDSFGISLSLQGDLLAVGAYLDDEARVDAGAGFIFRRDGESGKWGLEQKLMASEAGIQDYLGYTIGLDGDFCVLGGYRDDEEATDGGALYVYRYLEGEWLEVFKLVAGDAEQNDWLGFATAISGDTVLAGAPRDDDFGEDVGAAYLFDISLQIFKRGDTNGDGQTVGIVDGIFLMSWGFLGGPAPPCMDAADVDGNNQVSPLSDPLRLLRWAFSDGVIPPSPGPYVCGIDPDQDEDVDCETSQVDCN